ncbi:MAG: hypothetical protein ACI90V_004719, partial [Bacillariaceae sp.]
MKNEKNEEGIKNSKTITHTILYIQHVLVTRDEHKF